MSLPIVLPNNASQTLKDMLSGSNNQTNLFDLKKLQVYAGQQGNQTGNAESFFMGSKFEKIFQFLKRLTESVINSIVGANDALHQKLNEMNNNLVEMIKAINNIEGEEDDEPLEESPFENEQKENQKKKMKEKEIGLLESIFKQMSNNAMGWLSPSLLKKYGLNEEKSSLPDISDTYFGAKGIGAIKDKGKDLIKYAGTFKVVQMLTKGIGALTRLTGTVLLPLAGIYGMIKEVTTGEITGGKSLEGIRGAARFVGSGIAQMMSLLTFGLVDAKTIYPYLAEAADIVSSSLKSLTIGMLTGLKNGALWVWDTLVMPVIDNIDAQLQVAFGKQYEDIKKATLDKLNYIKEGALNISKKLWGVLGSSVEWVYDKYLDYINWVEAGASLEISAISVSDMLHKGLNYLMGNKPLELGEKGLEHEARSKLTEESKKRDPKMDNKNKKNPDGNYCYSGVNKSLVNSKIINSGDLSGESAYMAADQLETLGFEEITSGWQYSGADVLPKLDNGLIYVINKSKGHEHGHIAVTMGNGEEWSDRKRSIGTQTIDRANTAGFRIFKPVRKNENESFKLKAPDIKPENSQALSSNFNYKTGLGDKTVDLGFDGAKTMLFDANLNTTGSQNKRIEDIGSKIIDAAAIQTPIMSEQNNTPPIINTTNINNNISSNDTSTSFGDTLKKILNWTAYLNLNRRNQ